MLSGIAQQFLSTEAQKKPIIQVTHLRPNITVEEAYQVQHQVINMISEQGYKRIGKKVGFTSSAAQNMAKLNEPAYGELLDRYQVPSGGVIDTSSFIKPLLECEIAFVMGQTLTGPNITPAKVMAATESFVAAFEIVDFRTQDWAIGKYEAIAYNVFIRHFVLNPTPIQMVDTLLPDITIDLHKNGTLLTSGDGRNVLNDPANSVAWLVNKLANHGQSLQAGELVLAGSLTSLVPIESGDYFEARFDTLGTVSVKFE